MYAINDNGTLKWGVMHAIKNEILNTDSSTTQSDINSATKMLVNSALSSGTWTIYEVGWAKANYDDTGGANENLFTVQSSRIGAYTDDGQVPTLVTMGGNGYGSTNTAIRRLTSTLGDTAGEFMADVHSATLGTSFTCLQRGLYALQTRDRDSGSSFLVGISINSNQLTTAISGIASGDILAMAQFSAATIGQASVDVYLNPGDVIRPHTGIAINNSTDTGFVSLSARLVRRA